MIGLYCTTGIGLQNPGQDGSALARFCNLALLLTMASQSGHESNDPFLLFGPFIWYSEMWMPLNEDSSGM